MPHGDEFELNDRDERLRRHATLCSIGFVVLLPFGALIGRYLRTFTSTWFWAHWVIQFLVSGPIIFVGWSLGYKSVTEAFTGHFMDTHEKIGLVLLILYCIQVFLGAIIHVFKMPPSLLGGHRPPQNYLHAILGLAIIALAFYQVHYGLTTEWVVGTLDGTIVPHSAMSAWIGLIVVFWALYAIGLVLLPRQYKKESASRAQIRANEKNMTYHQNGSDA